MLFTLFGAGERLLKIKKPAHNLKPAKYIGMLFPRKGVDLDIVS